MERDGKLELGIGEGGQTSAMYHQDYDSGQLSQAMPLRHGTDLDIKFPKVTKHRSLGYNAFGSLVEREAFWVAGVGKIPQTNRCA